MPLDKWSLSVKLATVLLLCLLGMRLPMAAQEFVRQEVSPNRTNHFTPPKAAPAALRLSTTAHYQLDGGNHSIEEFAALLPQGGHTVHVDNSEGQTQLYTVTLFHQLKCLEIIQRDYVSERPRIQPLSPASRHCLNYLKQMFLCRPSLGVESIVNAYEHAVRSYELLCDDWTNVYAEAHRNQEIWKQSKNKHV